MFDDFTKSVGDVLGNTVEGISNLASGIFAPAGTSSTPAQQTAQTQSQGWDWQGINDWLTGAATTVGQIRDIFDPPQASASPVVSTPFNTPGYDPNLSISDFTFKPNWWLIAFGVVILLLVMSKR